MTASLDERFIKAVGCHFVTLSCVRSLPDGSAEKVLVFSGFLAEAGGAWFYVTAGHILKDIRAAITAGAKSTSGASGTRPREIDSKTPRSLTPLTSTAGW